MDIRAYFDPRAGLLARAVRPWEPRPQQVRMAEAVARCLEGGGACAIEAATGTGKTFAYLVPAILCGGRVVVATGTRNLEDQLFQKDLPMLRALPGLDVRAVVLKGLSNYLCRRRFESFALGPSAPSTRLDRDWARLVEWAAGTETGDVSEIEGVPESSPILREITSGQGLHNPVGCPNAAECHVMRARKEAEKARLVIVNHHLFFADLGLREKGAGVLPAYDAVIFDEAHRLEDVATEFFGLTSSLREVEATMAQADRAMRDGEDGAVEGRARGRRRRARDPVLAETSRAAASFFEAIGRRMGDLAAARRSGRWSLAEIQPVARIGLGGEDTYLDERTERLYHQLDDLLENASIRVSERAGDADLGASVSGRIADHRDALAAVLDRGLENQVYWAEVSAEDASATRIGASPVDLAPLFRERVFEKVGSVVMTSATLSADGTMQHLSATIGYPEAEAESHVMESPFDLAGASILYIPEDVPAPFDDGAAERVASEVTRLVELTGGGALVLFSSWRAMKRCFGICRDTLRDYEIFCQGQAPKDELTRRLRESGDAVLLATASFREGVDVPGRALRLVVMDKIPFGVPDDPVIEARMARIRSEGGDPFTRYQLPSAAIAMKQGLGRLIRTGTDRGVLAILDPRFWTRSYGKKLLRALPGCPVTREFADVEEFWGRMSAPRPGR